MLLSFLLIFVGGCGKQETGDYDIYQTSYQYGVLKGVSEELSERHLMGASLCKNPTADFGTDLVTSQVAQGAALFNVTEQQTLYAQNINAQLYPASTTKIFTLYVALKYGNLDQEMSVSPNAVDQASDSSVCHLEEGDILTLRQALYGMMLRSGNDAAIAVAEGVSGDVDSFVALMNQEALLLGATNTHFVNPNGLHDDQHYTTVYDMYLMLNEAVKIPAFLEIFGATQYDAIYRDARGNTKTQHWVTTNQYISGRESAPDGFTVIGGKTGTTGKAGYCLVLLSENADRDSLISIVFGADCRSNLYYLMNQILRQFGS